MYLAMSRLKVASGKEVEFEASWKARESNTDVIKVLNNLIYLKEM